MIKIMTTEGEVIHLNGYGTKEVSTLCGIKPPTTLIFDETIKEEPEQKATCEECKDIAKKIAMSYHLLF